MRKYGFADLAVGNAEEFRINDIWCNPSYYARG